MHQVAIQPPTGSTRNRFAFAPRGAAYCPPPCAATDRAFARSLRSGGGRDDRVRGDELAVTLIAVASAAFVALASFLAGLVAAGGAL